MDLDDNYPTMTGELDLRRPAVDRVPGRPREAMELALARMVVEEGALNHHSDQVWIGDIAMWRIGMGLVDALDLVAIDAPRALCLTS